MFFAKQINACGVVFCLRQNWIATIFSTKKSRNDIGLCFRLPEILLSV
ncbi:MAG: hypothetical protein IKZ88_07215 [Neisseriaceae bacterium]|nr:hypothetical protein [Neisseriaceae bacterium]